MAHPHGPLTRTNTTPVFPAIGANTSLPSLSQTVSHASQSSGSTVYASSSSTSLSSMTSSATLVASPNSASVVPTNNIINQRADASRSLYQICVNLRQRLAQVPGFDAHLHDTDNEDEGEDMDPVSSLWRCLRKGTPLMTIYNSLRPAELLRMDETMAKNPKKPAFKFVEACLRDLKLPPGECFTLSDLFGNDTTGFVKVTQVINYVLDSAESQGLLLTAEKTDVAPTTMTGSQMSYRDYVVRELVDTERKYVQDLENLYELKKCIEQKGVIPGDAVHDIFLNINAILDFQRRFLIKIETTNSQPADRQEWGLPFTNYEEAFDIYQPFIANQRKAADIAKREFDKIVLADHPVVVDFNTLDGFLLKPMQRLVKYPLLLKDLRDKTDADEETKADLTAGIEASNRVLRQANEAVDRELRNEALVDLIQRVDDWKKHRIDHFGELLLHGHFPVVTGKSDIQKDYTVYLFERILLCCKEVNPTKPKDKLMSTHKDKKDKKDKRDTNKGVKLQLKGRIFMNNVTEVVSLGKQGSYTIQIFWKGDPGVENFIIRFSNEETMSKWYAGVDNQRKAHIISTLQAGADNAPVDFTWMRDQGSTLSNPYAQHDDDDDDDDFASQQQQQPSQPTSPYAAQAGMPRNASNTSLRARSMTGESQQSLAGIARAPPPRFPMGTINPPLSLQTTMSGGMPSPSQRGGDSYFSPAAESPNSSSRTSTASSMFPFPRQGTPQGTWEDPSNRYTAPAVARAPSRDSSTPSNAYQMNGRTPQRPSLPAMASGSSQGSTSSQQRSRSYSTPNVNGPNGSQRNATAPPSGPIPAVPGIPSYLQQPQYDPGISRSANDSPMGIPLRSTTQSPGSQRDRQQVPYTNATQYSRPNTGQAPPETRTVSPPLGLSRAAESDLALPTQLKVKVNCDGNYVTLVVAFNITYQSLIDRIDAKVGRFSNNAISRGTMRLRYRDEDGDYVTIESDDDIQIAFQEWREEQRQQYYAGFLGEIELFCLSVDN